MRAAGAYLRGFAAVATLRGFRCPTCQGVRAFVVLKTHRPAPGVVVRYQRCTACRTRIKTEERAVPKGPDNTREYPARRKPVP